jgi:ABC-2 type transport system permease protein
MKILLNMIGKDLKILFSDKKALIIILLMPVILMTILSFALKGIFMNDWEAGRVNIAVVKNYDAAADERRFAGALQNSLFSGGMGPEAVSELVAAGREVDPEALFFHDFLESEEVSEIISYRVESRQRAEELLESGEVSAVVTLPGSYLFNMKINLVTPFRNKVGISVITNPDASIDGYIVRSVMEAYSDAMSSIIIGKNVLIEAAVANESGDADFSGIEDVMEGIRAALESVRVEVEDIALEGTNPISSANYYAAAMLAMFVLFAAGHGGRMLLEEKDQYTFQRMSAAGVSRMWILAGKFFTVFLIALMQVAVMTVFSRIALKVQWGEILSVVLIGIAAAAAVAGVGAAVGAATYRTGNQRMASLFETVVIQSMALLGGSFFPLDIMPAALQHLSFLSLSGIVLSAYQKTMMGYGLDEVLGYIGILALTGAVFAAIAVILMRERREAVNA